MTPSDFRTSLYSALSSGKQVEDLLSKILAQLESSNYEIQLAASDETTALTAGTSKITFRALRDFTLNNVHISLTTAQTSGNIFTVDINKNGVSVLSTKLTIDNTEKSSHTAATSAVISTASFSKYDEISIDIDQIGDGTAKGLKVGLECTKI